MQPRPTSLTVFGILNLLFAVMGVFGLLYSLVMFYVPDLPGLKDNPVIELLHSNPSYNLFMKVSIALGFFAAVVLGLAGAGLLLMKPWGRYLSIGYGLYAIVAGVVGMVANYFWLIAPLMEKAAKSHGGPEQAGLIGGAIGGAFGGCFGMIYPIVLLYFMFRPNVINALHAERFDDILRAR